MDEPRYAAHERIVLRGRSLDEGSPDHVTYSMYTQLVQHVIRSYPEGGPLRSVALRKVAESLNDILDHADLVRLRDAHVSQKVDSVENSNTPTRSDTAEHTPDKHTEVSQE